MILLALVLAGMAGTSAEDRRRAALYEARNRLGVGPPGPSRSDVRARWIVAQAWLDAQANGNLAADVAVALRGWLFYTAHLQGGQVPVPPGADPWIPSEGVHHPVERVLPWLARALYRYIDDDPLARRGLSPTALVACTQALSRHLVPMLDWIDATAPDLGPLSWDQALAASGAWHARFATTIAFRAPVPPALVVVRFADGMHIDRLVERRQFADEGASMGHCVGGPRVPPDGYGSYWQATRDDRNVVYSLRDARDVPQGTVEVDLTGSVPMVVQVQGPQDQAIRDRVVLQRLGWFLTRFLPATDRPGGTAVLFSVPYVPTWIREEHDLRDRRWPGGLSYEAWRAATLEVLPDAVEVLVRHVGDSPVDHPGVRVLRAARIVSAQPFPEGVTWRIEVAPGGSTPVVVDLVAHVPAEVAPPGEVTRVTWTAQVRQGEPMGTRRSSPGDRFYFPFEALHAAGVVLRMDEVGAALDRQHGSGVTWVPGFRLPVPPVATLGWGRTRLLGALVPVPGAPRYGGTGGEPSALHGAAWRVVQAGGAAMRTVLPALVALAPRPSDRARTLVARVDAVLGSRVASRLVAHLVDPGDWPRVMALARIAASSSRARVEGFTLGDTLFARADALDLDATIVHEAIHLAGIDADTYLRRSFTEGLVVVLTAEILGLSLPGIPGTYGRWARAVADGLGRSGVTARALGRVIVGARRPRDVPGIVARRLAPGLRRPVDEVEAAITATSTAEHEALPVL